MKNIKLYTMRERRTIYVTREKIPKECVFALITGFDSHFPQVRIGPSRTTLCRLGTSKRVGVDSTRRENECWTILTESQARLAVELNEFVCFWCKKTKM